MKGESRFRKPSARGLSPAESEDIAVAVLDRLVSDPERLGRFLSLSGLDPAQIRKAASEPGFLPAVLDHVMSDETLLRTIADEIGAPPERVAAAHRLVSPEPDWSA